MNSERNSSHPLNRPPGARGLLTELLEGVTVARVKEDDQRVAECRVEHVTADSRTAKAHGLFIALPGTITDGHRHVEDAAAGGCSSVIVEQGRDYTLPKGWKGVVVEVQDAREAYATISENFYGRPAAKMRLVGITGTNGKTTTTYLVEDVLVRLGYKVGVIGTVNYRYTCGEKKVVLPSPFTTPEAMQLQGLLYEMAQAGVEVLIMEVSSHALAQQRIGNLRYDVAAFTNLSRDHLDYHQTMEDYFQAKELLFTHHLKDGALAIISTPQQPEGDVDWSERVVQRCRELGYSVERTGKVESAGVRLLDYTSTLTQTQVRVRLDDKKYSFTTPLVGHFNIDNLLTAFGVLRGLGCPVEHIVAGLSRCSGAPGRLERVTVGTEAQQSRPVVFVDYAHTPDALRQVLATLSALPHRDLFCVFGCGGDRDGGKRPVMGTFAATFATVTFVTDDNPRTEDPDRIRSQIVPGVEKTGLEERSAEWLKLRSSGERGYLQIGDRSEAIERAIQAAGPGDIVLIAGKGHENYQLGISGKRFFDDCLEARCALLSWTPATVAMATGGDLRTGTEGQPGADISLGDVSTDSRTIRKGDIFVALRGEKFDAHDFLGDVAEKGAGCLVVERKRRSAWPQNVARVEVGDTLQALGDLAHYRRRSVDAVERQCAIAITGSCGKTTVKEMTAAIMRRHFPAGPDHPENAVLATKGNLNNLIGLPLTLLPITPRQRVAVLEMGMNAPGEIAQMARAAEPDICCITNVHGVHLEGLGDIDGVAKAKGELFTEAGREATLIVNLDDEKICGLVADESRPMVTFSVSSDEADLYAADIVTSGSAIGFTLHCGAEFASVTLQTVGNHNIPNALAAAAICRAAGVSLETIISGLEDFRPTDKRMVQLKTSSGTGLINDTYNANPASMEAGLMTLIGLGGKCTLALLGDMLELGATSSMAHRQLGEKAARLGVNFLGVVGSFRKEVYRGAVEAGMPEDNVQVFATKEDAASWAEQLMKTGQIGENDWILVKASRGLRMETIVERLAGKT